MAKKKLKPVIPDSTSVPEQKQQKVVSNLSFVPDLKMTVILYDFKFQAILVALLAIIFYLNTFQNEYALDDNMVIVQNEYVLEGFKGIPDILTKDAYESFYKRVNTTDQVPGGRYRPLSIVTFAIEQQFLGSYSKTTIDSIFSYGSSGGVKEAYKKKLAEDMHVRHIFNVLWYALSVVVLLYFLRYVVFRSNPVMALLAAVIFTIHPIHTEVVANVKSRDEIMSLLFMCLTLISAFKYQEDKKKWRLGLGLLSYFLAFLSKEYAITIIFLLPLALYLFNNYSIKKSALSTLPYMGVVAIYIFMRLLMMHPTETRSETADRDIQLNPYAYASGSEKLATEIATPLYYLKLLIYPNPLSADYSYNTIPYKDFTNLLVWLSLLVHIALILAFFIFLKKQKILSFAIAFYLSHLLLVCNLVFNLGGTIGERLIYHSSVGFSIAAGYLLYKGMEKIKPAAAGKALLAGCMIVLILLSGFKTIERNADWKSDETLFSKDLTVVPDAILTNCIVGSNFIGEADNEKDEKAKQTDLHNAIKLLNKATSLDSTYATAHLNKAIAYFKLGELDSCVISLDEVRKLYQDRPELPTLYQDVAILLTDKAHNEKNPEAQKNAINKAVNYLNKLAAIYPRLETAEIQLGSLYFNMQQYDLSEIHDKKALQLNPGNIDVITNLAHIYFVEKKYPQAIELYKRGIGLYHDRVNLYTNVAACYGSMGQYDSAICYANKAVILDPTFKGSYQLLASTYNTIGKLDSARKYEAIAQK